jgi:hypothetical protein
MTIESRRLRFQGSLSTAGVAVLASEVALDKRRQCAYRMGMATWQEVKAAALKILGDDAEVPDIPDSSPKALKSLKKAGDEFEKSRAACEDKLLALRNANASVRSDLTQLREGRQVGLQPRSEEQGRPEKNSEGTRAISRRHR